MHCLYQMKLERDTKGSVIEKDDIMKRISKSFVIGPDFAQRRLRQ